MPIKQTKYREKTKYKGLYTRISKNRINPRDGKPDVIYDMTIKVNGKVYYYTIGSKSEGFSLEIANNERLKKASALRLGKVLPEEYKPKHVNTFDEARTIVKERHLNNLARPVDEEKRYSLHIEPFISNLGLQLITVYTIEGLKQTWMEKKLAPATMRLLLADIRVVYNKMIHWGLYNGENPIAKVEMPKVDNERVRFLARKEADMLMAALKLRSEFWWNMAMISLHSGLRLSEIYNLRKNEIDLCTNTIYVRDGKAGSRAAKFDNRIAPVLKQIMDETLESAGLLFPSIHGTVRKPCNGHRVFFDVVDKLGLNKGIDDSRYKVVFHTLRHTFASWLAISGVPLYTIQKLLGHKSIKQTERYSHLCPGVMNDAANLIGQFLDYQAAA